MPLGRVKRPTGSRQRSKGLQASAVHGAQRRWQHSSRLSSSPQASDLLRGRLNLYVWGHSGDHALCLLLGACGRLGLNLFDDEQTGGHSSGPQQCVGQGQVSGCPPPAEAAVRWLPLLRALMSHDVKPCARWLRWGSGSTALLQPEHSRCRQHRRQRCGSARSPAVQAAWRPGILWHPPH